MASINSTNPTVQRALNAKPKRAAKDAVSKNAAASVLVTFNAVTAKGLEKVQAKMSAVDFEAWAKKIGVGSALQNVWLALMKGEVATVYTHPTVISVREI